MFRLAGILVFVCAYSSFAQQVGVEADSVKKPVDAANVDPTAQVVVDTVKQPVDSLVIRKGRKVITIESYAKRYQPRKALLYSAAVPGMGQVYNKKYWKVPIIYGGFYFLTSYAKKYNDYVNKYKNELFFLLEHPAGTTGSSTSTTNGSTTTTGPTSPSGYTEQQLRDIIDNYRRQRDYFIILDGFLYILQLVDAHVDAHLKEFDLNPQLKVSLEPSVQQNGLIGRTSGFSLTLKF